VTVPAVAFYISGHGFGHASRQIEIINALGAASPETPILIRTSAPPWLFERTLRVPATLIAGEIDTGVVQIDSLHLDATETIRRAAAFYHTLDERARAEADLLRRHRVGCIVADAPPLGCAAAHAAGIDSVVVSNFTWDWIYEGYAAELREAPGLRERLGQTYALAAAGWRLPMYGGFETIARRRDLPFVARHARHSRDQVRRVCGLSSARPIALLSFGGYGVRDVDLELLDCRDAVTVLLTHDGSFDDPVPEGVAVLSEPYLYGSGLRYEDLVSAVDVVITKPGYGIISECVANRTALLYTSRGRFAEYEVLVREMPRYLRCGYLDHEDLFAGRWRAALQALLESPEPPEHPPTNGAEVAARLLIEWL
jgi:hypothetical protein